MVPAEAAHLYHHRWCPVELSCRSSEGSKFFLRNFSACFQNVLVDQQPRCSLEILEIVSSWTFVRSMKKLSLRGGSVT